MHAHGGDGIVLAKYDVIYAEPQSVGKETERGRGEEAKREEKGGKEKEKGGKEGKKKEGTYM